MAVTLTRRGRLVVLVATVATAVLGVQALHLTDSGSAGVPAVTAVTAPTPTTPPYDDDADCAVVDCVALTFDDGPSGDTSALLDVLSAHGARATFFVVGSRVEERPELVAREAAEGHEIGNHTWSHAYAVGQIVDTLRARGLHFVTVTHLLDNAPLEPGVAYFSR